MIVLYSGDPTPGSFRTCGNHPVFHRGERFSVPRRREPVIIFWTPPRPFLSHRHSGDFRELTQGRRDLIETFQLN